MRIICDACGAKYQVEDDKVRNRSFKFPCKKCNHIVVVRQTHDAAEDNLNAASEPDQDVEGSGSAFEATKQLNYDDHLAQQALQDLDEPRT